MHSILRYVLPMLLVALLLTGCDTSNDRGKDREVDTRTAGQYFKEEQAATVTPHGRIRTETVVEKDGRIEYETDNGMKWSVTYSKRSDGTYRYNTPERRD